MDVHALPPFLALCAAANAAAASLQERTASAPCEFTPAATASQRAPGLMVGAEVLLPTEGRLNQGVQIRLNGGLGMLGISMPGANLRFVVSLAPRPLGAVIFRKVAFGYNSRPRRTHSKDAR